MKVPTLLLLLTAATAAATAGAAVTSSSGLTTLRVCGTNAVPFSGSECRKNQRGRPLLAGELDCSVRAVVTRTTNFTAELRYRGRREYSYHQALHRGRYKRLIGVYYHNTPVPGGPFSCTFALGRLQLRTAFRSAGPTGAILGPAACLGSHTVNQNECPRDESGSPLPSTSSVNCSAVFPNAEGSAVEADLVRLVGPAAVVVQSKRDTLRYPITEWGATFSGPTPFVSGDYACRFLLAGQRVAEKPFRIS